jgi:hypothetical protein
MECRRGEPALFGLILAARITLPHFSVSSLTKFRPLLPDCAARSLWRSFHEELAKEGGSHAAPLRSPGTCCRHLNTGSPAVAQDSWPSKPISVIVPFGAGGNTDGLARIYSARLSARLGQQCVIENRVGAGSIIGITSLAKAAPDGYTIGVGTSAGLAINPAILKENLGYTPRRTSPIFI